MPTDRTRPRWLREEDGNVAVVAALSMSMLMGFAALGVDAAALYRARAQLQSVADLTAMSALADPSRAGDGAEAALAGNRKSAGSLTVLETGRYLRNPALPPADRFRPLPPGSEGINAVRVALAEAAPLHFARAFTTAQTVTLSGTATAARTGAASFSLTSHLARLDGATLDQALSQGLGGSITLQAGDAALFGAARVNLGALLAALARDTGFDSRNPAAILDAETTAPAVLRALASLVPADVAARLAVLAAASAGTALPVASLASGADTALGLSVTEAAAQVDLSVLEVLGALAAARLSGHRVDAATALAVPGVLDASAELSLGEPPAQSGWIALGERGVTLHRAAARLNSDLRFDPALLGSLGTGVTVTRVHLPVTVELAGARATLDEIRCGETDPADPVVRFLTAPTPLHPANGTSVAALYLGTPATAAGPIDPATLGFADIMEVSLAIDLPLLPDIRIDGVTIQARSHVTVGQSQTASVGFTAAEIAAGDTTRRFGSGALLRTGVASLLDPARTEFRVKPGQSGLSQQVSAVLSAVLALLPGRLAGTLASPLDGGLQATLDSAGLRLGEGELTLTGRHCELIRLVR